MWGFIVALISGALMSIQGVFNTGGDKADQPLGINRMGTAVGFCSLRSCLAFYRTGKCGCTLAGGQ